MTTDITVVDPESVSERELLRNRFERMLFEFEEADMAICRIPEGATTAWHHHGDHDVFGYVRAGQGELEFGTRGEKGISFERGEFFHIPAGVVHREMHVTGQPPELVTVRYGSGERTVPVEGPRSAGRHPRFVGPDDLVPTVESPNLTRETPFPDEDVLLMRVRTEGETAAGWHHHADNRYFGYVVNGSSETQYGPDGEQVTAIDAGEMFHVPRGLLHRDTNPTDERHEGIIWLCGGEPWVVNVDGPAESSG